MEYFDVWIAREWKTTPEDVRSWLDSDVDRCLELLEAEGMVRKKRDL